MLSFVPTESKVIIKKYAMPVQGRMQDFGEGGGGGGGGGGGFHMNN